MDYSVLLGYLLMYVPFPTYVALQLYAPVRYKGWWRVAALLPLLVMIPVVWLTVILFNQESNLWPIFLILVSPIAALYLAALVLCEHHRRRRSATMKFKGAHRAPYLADAGAQLT